MRSRADRLVHHHGCRRARDAPRGERRDRYARRTLGPIAGILALTGLMMTVWPLHVWNMLAPSGRWALAGLAGFLALNIILPVGAGGAMRALIGAGERGEVDSLAAQKGWKRLGRAMMAGEAVYAIVVAVMVIKPAF